MDKIGAKLIILIFCIGMLMHSFRVSVYAGISDSIGLEVTIDNEVPGPITDLIALAETLEGTIDLLWTAPHENNFTGGRVEGYVVRYATFSAASLSNNATAWWIHPATITGLEIPSALVKNPGESESNYIQMLWPGATYYFAIRSYDSTGLWSDYDTNSYGIQASTVAIDIKPVTPTGYNVISVSTTSVNLVWNDMSGQSGYLDFDYYVIYRSTEINSPQIISTTTMLTYNDSNITVDTTYYYWLAAVDNPPTILSSDLTSGVTVYVSKGKIKNVKPRKPAGIMIRIVDNKIQLKWSNVKKNEDGTDLEDGSGFRIYRSNNLYDGWTQLGFTPYGTDNYFTWTDDSLTGLSLGEIYYYKIRTVDSFDNESKDSMICDTSSNLNVIGLSSDKQTFISVPQFISDIMYKGTRTDDDIIIEVSNTTEPSIPDVLAVYELTALKSLSGEKIANFKFDTAKAKISIRYDTKRNSVSGSGGVSVRKAGDKIDEKDISLFWHNGVEWTKISSIIEGNALTTLSSRLGKYMIKPSIRATSFVVTKVYPQIFTPDCDNRNDYVEFQYDNPLDGNPFGRIYDLKGALVSELKKGSNYNSFTWDGRTMAGDIARPGAYVYQIEITGSETKAINGVVILAK